MFYRLNKTISNLTIPTSTTGFLNTVPFPLTIKLKTMLEPHSVVTDKSNNNGQQQKLPVAKDIPVGFCTVPELVLQSTFDFDITNPSA